MFIARLVTIRHLLILAITVLIPTSFIATTNATAITTVIRSCSCYYQYYFSITLILNLSLAPNITMTITIVFAITRSITIAIPVRVFCLIRRFYSIGLFTCIRVIIV